MTSKTASIAQLMKERGYSRREFLYLSGAVAAAAGLGAHDVARAVRTLESTGRRRVLRILFAGTEERTSRCTAAYLIGSDLICETKCFALADDLSRAQSARLAKRISAAVEGVGGYLMLVEGAPKGESPALETVRATASDATSVVSLESGPSCVELFAAAAADLLANAPADDDAPLVDSWETAAAREGFAVFRAELFGAPENLPRLPYRPAAGKQYGLWKTEGAPPSAVPPKLSGVALHALTSNVPKHKLIRENIDEESRPFGGRRGGADRANFTRGGNSPQRLVTGEK